MANFEDKHIWLCLGPCFARTNFPLIFLKLFATFSPSSFPTFPTTPSRPSLPCHFYKAKENSIFLNQGAMCSSSSMDMSLILFRSGSTAKYGLCPCESA